MVEGATRRGATDLLCGCGRSHLSRARNVRVESSGRGYGAAEEVVAARKAARSDRLAS